MDDIEDGELPSSPEIDDEPYKPLERPSLPPQMVSFIILKKIVKWLAYEIKIQIFHIVPV